MSRSAIVVIHPSHYFGFLNAIILIIKQSGNFSLTWSLGVESIPADSRQFITGRQETKRDKQPYTFTFTPIDNIEWPVDLTPDACLWMRGSWSTPREPPQTQGKHANTSHRKDSLAVRRSANHCCRDGLYDVSFKNKRLIHFVICLNVHQQSWRVSP